jgi:hypothetical protein
VSNDDEPRPARSLREALKGGKISVDPSLVPPGAKPGDEVALQAEVVRHDPARGLVLVRLSNGEEHWLPADTMIIDLEVQED